MSDFVILSEGQARAIVHSYNNCSGCAECPLNTPEGWRCGYLYDCARKYLLGVCIGGENNEPT